MTSAASVSRQTRRLVGSAASISRQAPASRTIGATSAGVVVACQPTTTTATSTTATPGVVVAIATATTAAATSRHRGAHAARLRTLGAHKLAVGGIIAERRILRTLGDTARSHPVNALEANAGYSGGGGGCLPRSKEQLRVSIKYVWALI